MLQQFGSGIHSQQESLQMTVAGKKRSEMPQ